MEEKLSVIKKQPILLIPFGVLFILQLFSFMGWTYFFLGTLAMDYFPFLGGSLLLYWMITIIVSLIPTAIALMLYPKSKNKTIFWVVYVGLVVIFETIFGPIIAPLFDVL